MCKIYARSGRLSSRGSNAGSGAMTSNLRCSLVMACSARIVRTRTVDRSTGAPPGPARPGYGRAPPTQGSPPRLHGRRLPSTRDILSILLVLVVAVSVRLAAQAGLDLEDVPGPAGPTVLTQAIHVIPGKDWPMWLLDAAVRLPFLEDRLAAGLWSIGWWTAGIGGLMLAAGALGGTAAAVGAGLLAATWSPLVLSSTVLAMDTPAVAMAWLAVGIAWSGARQGRGGLFLCLLAGALAVVAPQPKLTGLTPLPFLLLAPLLARRGWGNALGVATALALGTWICWSLARFPLRMDETIRPGPPDPATLRAGLEAIWDMASRRAGLGYDGAFPELMVLAGASALVPGRRPREALLLALGTAAVLGFSASTLDLYVQPRLLVGPALGLLVLGGYGFGSLATWLHRLGPTRHLPLVVTAAFLLLDTTAWLGRWADLRVAEVGTAPPTIPRAPRAWSARYDALGFDTSLSVRGGRDLVRLGVGAPRRGVAGVPLQDSREAHLQVGAAMAGHPTVILTRTSCCPDPQADLLACAQDTVDQVQRAGALLVLPLFSNDYQRVPRQELSWISALLREAEGRPGRTAMGRWWQVLPPPPAPVDDPAPPAPLPCQATPPPGRPGRPPAPSPTPPPPVNGSPSPGGPR